MRKYIVVSNFLNLATQEYVARFRFVPLTIVSKPDSDIVAIYNKEYQMIDCDKWKMTVDELKDFIAENGSNYNYSSPSSFALSLYRRDFEPENCFIGTYQSYRARFIRASLYGGRAECYRHGERYLYQYDINSAYPWCASRMTFPTTTDIFYEKSGTLDNIKRLEGVSRVTFSQDGTYPILPVRYGGRVYYAECERVTGNYTNAELRYAIQCGVKIHSVHNQYVAHSTVKPFEKFMWYCFNKRVLTGKKIWKLIANSLIGRLSVVSGNLNYYKQVECAKEWNATPRHMRLLFGGLRFSGEERLAMTYSNVLHSSMVLSVARCELHSMITRYGAYYAHTDCIFVNHKIPLPIGNDMGQFKLSEGVYNLKGPGMYIKDSREVKLKGVENADLSAFDRSENTQERKILPNGSTIPYRIEGHNVQIVIW